MQKSLAFLYTTNKRSDRWETISFTIASKRIKYLGINLPKEAKDLSQKPKRYWWKKWDHTNRWRDILCSWIEKINIVKMTWASLVAQMVKKKKKRKKERKEKERKKKSAYNAGTQIKSLGQEDLLEKWMATHSSILAWRTPWTGEPGGLQSMGLQRTGHDWANKPAHMHPRWSIDSEQSLSNSQCHFSQNKKKKFFLTICMETWKTSNTQSNPEKEKQLEESGSLTSDYTTKLLAQNQQHRSMEPDRKPRGKPTHLWSPNLWQRRQEYTMEKRHSLQEVVLGKLDSYL